MAIPRVVTKVFVFVTMSQLGEGLTLVTGHIAETATLIAADPEVNERDLFGREGGDLWGEGGVGTRLYR